MPCELKSQRWGLLPIESTYLVCLVNAYAVRGRTKVLRGGSGPAARPRSLEGTLIAIGLNCRIYKVLNAKPYLKDLIHLQ